MTNFKLLYFVFLFTLFLYFASSSSLNSNHKCAEEQSDALLLFKQSLSSINLSVDDPSYFEECKDILGSAYYPIMMNWSTNTDCCNWDGITCDYFTGDVIGIDLSCGMLQGTIHPNSTLFHIPHLYRLNLAFNDFTGSQIPREIGKFSNSLTHLNISRCGLGGQIPSEILFLPRLISLDLSLNYGGLNIQPTVFNNLLQNATHLRELSLAGIDVSSVLPTYFNTSSSLKTLDLSSTNLLGKLPDNIFNLPYLQKLDLSGNSELTGLLQNANTSTNIPLKWLDLSDTILSGQIPDSIGNMKYLNYLDLSSTDLSGKIPESIGNLKFLSYLDLSRTGLSGKIPESIGNLISLNHLALSHCNLMGSLPKSLVNLKNLSTINLSSNMLNGMLPSKLFTLPSLENLWLRDNMFSGGLPSSVLTNYSALKELSLGYNRFDGEINQGFIHLMNLTYLDLQHNNFTGLWELDILLSSLPKLVALHLSYSGLYVMASNVTGYVMNTDLVELALASCKLTMFPGCLQGMKNLVYLNLSENYIQGRIPDWAGVIGGNQLYSLDLSNNLITGLPAQLQWDGLLYLYLQSNQIEGHFPLSICNMSNLRFLDMSNNRFGGVIPQCFENIFSSVVSVIIRNNSFHGTIPNVNVENCKYLEGFILNGNQLKGDVPSFLSKCPRLKILDIGNNLLNGTFPTWLGNLPLLQILVLKQNTLTGLIKVSPTVEHPFFPRLQILDLSQNGLGGRLPEKYFQNFIAMKNVVTEGPEPQYLRLYDKYYSLTIEVKGHQQLFSKINVHYTIVDLSYNKFEGEIPTVIGSLNSLIALNLSHNNLNGRIPYALRNLSAIESLDLSWNQLIGEIPHSLVDMKNLVVLNLSQNHLVGRIPKGKQFNTFEENSFGGNLGLCGHPLPQLCEHVSSPQVEDDGDNEESGVTWKEVMLGYGCGTLIGMVVGYLMLSTGKPKWFNAIADAVEHTTLKKENTRRSTRK